jgi:hypothetical protein
MDARPVICPGMHAPRAPCAWWPSWRWTAIARRRPRAHSRRMLAVEVPSGPGAGNYRGSAMRALISLRTSVARSGSRGTIDRIVFRRLSSTVHLSPVMVPGTRRSSTCAARVGIGSPRSSRPEAGCKVAMCPARASTLSNATTDGVAAATSSVLVGSRDNDIRVEEKAHTATSA